MPLGLHVSHHKPHNRWAAEYPEELAQKAIDAGHGKTLADFQRSFHDCRFSAQWSVEEKRARYRAQNAQERDALAPWIASYPTDIQRVRERKQETHADGPDTALDPFQRLIAG